MRTVTAGLLGLLSAALKLGTTVNDYVQGLGLEKASLSVKWIVNTSFYDPEDREENGKLP